MSRPDLRSQRLDYEAWARERLIAADQRLADFAKPVVCERCKSLSSVDCRKICVRPCICDHGR